MTQAAPGRSEREGISLVGLTRLFPNDAAAEAWFIKQRWPDGIHCHYCGSANVQTGAKHQTMPFRCRERTCAKRFSVRTGTVMQSSKLGFQVWAFAIYLLMTNLKGISSMKLHRELSITQRSAWYLAHRLRAAFAKAQSTPFAGPVEVDETYVGGKEKNRHQSQKRGLSGIAGKAIVVGAKDRASNQIAAQQVQGTDRETLHGFVQEHAAPDAAVYTDEHRSYQGLPHHQAVKHSVGQYVNGQVSTQGIDSFWSMVKRGYIGTFHHFSPKHLDRYVQEFAGRHNVRPHDTTDQMAALARGATGKRLRYQDLIAGGPAYPPPEGR